MLVSNSWIGAQRKLFTALTLAAHSPKPWPPIDGHPRRWQKTKGFRRGARRSGERIAERIAHLGQRNTSKADSPTGCASPPCSDELLAFSAANSGSGRKAKTTGHELGARAQDQHRQAAPKLDFVAPEAIWAAPYSMQPR